MKNLLIAGGAILLIGIIMVVYSNNVYNSAISNQETTVEMWGNVESSYQRRADLIPNLVNTVKG